LTAGGRRDAEMATPTNDPAFPPRTERATPAPDSNAMKAPTQRDRSCPLFVARKENGVSQKL